MPTKTVASAMLTVVKPRHETLDAKNPFPWFPWWPKLQQNHLLPVVITAVAIALLLSCLLGELVKR
jgi:hypothetical protein